LGHAKEFKSGICCFSYFKCCADDKETVNGFFVSENILLQSWRYKTLAVKKRYKNAYIYFLTKPNVYENGFSSFHAQISCLQF